MKNTVLLCGLTAVLLLIGACSGTTTNKPANANTSTALSTPMPAATTAPNTASSPASTSAAQDFTLVNETGVEIDKVFISPHDKDDWEEDVLGRDTLPNGQTVDIKFHRAETAAVWDLKIEDSKGNGIEWENLNLLEISKVTLYYKDGKGTAKVE
jgi:hypothetical protein